MDTSRAWLGKVNVGSRSTVFFSVFHHHFPPKNSLILEDQFWNIQNNVCYFRRLILDQYAWQESSCIVLLPTSEKALHTLQHAFQLKEAPREPDTVDPISLLLKQPAKPLPAEAMPLTWHPHFLDFVTVLLCQQREQNQHPLGLFQPQKLVSAAPLQTEPARQPPWVEVVAGKLGMCAFYL